MSLQPEPYLHRGRRRIYNPLSHRSLTENEPGYSVMIGLLEGELTCQDLEPDECARLLEEGWLQPEGLPSSDQRYYLRFVSLEAHSACNQACYFCPVSVAPRPDSRLSIALYEKIAEQLSRVSTLEAVFMNQYNEPTANPDFLEHVQILKKHSLPVALLTNGSGLHSRRVEAIREMGGIDYLCVNLSTLDSDRYREQRGVGHARKVLENLDYISDHQIAPTQDIVVLGSENETHRQDHAQISERYGQSFQVRFEPANDRSGYLTVGRSRAKPRKRLRGCNQTGSRPLQHLHITADARVVLCCQDYEGRYVLGDLSRQTIQEVLIGPEFARVRRLVYGLEEAEENFICRRCQFALS